MKTNKHIFLHTFSNRFTSKLAHSLVYASVAVASVSGAWIVASSNDVFAAQQAKKTVNHTAQAQVRATVVSLLETMQTTTGAVYEQARTELVKLASTDVVAKEILEDFTHQNAHANSEAEAQLFIWARVATAWITAPSACASVYHIPTLQPENYLAARLPKPEAARALRALSSAAQPVLAELILKTADTYPYSSSSATDTQNRQAEKDALQLGSVMALGKADPALATVVLESVVTSEKFPEAVRAAGFYSLGETRSARALQILTEQIRVVSDGSVLAQNIRAGLGIHRTAESARVLLAQLRQDNDAALLRADLVALRQLASKWAWQSLRQQNSEDSDAQLQSIRTNTAKDLRSYVENVKQKRANGVQFDAQFLQELDATLAVFQ